MADSMAAAQGDADRQEGGPDVEMVDDMVDGASGSVPSADPHARHRVEAAEVLESLAHQESTEESAGVAESATSNETDQVNSDSGQKEAAESKKSGSRGSKVEQAERKLRLLKSDLSIQEALVNQLSNMGGKKKREAKKLATAESKIERITAEIKLAEKALAEKKQSAALQAMAEEAKRKAAEEKEEAARSLTEAGRIHLVELYHKYQSKLDNSSDTNDKIRSHIHAAFVKLTENGTLPPSDARSVAALDKRYKLELGEFNLWVAKANRAMEFSGVTRDQVEELVRDHYNATTAIFLKNGYGLRPMATPAWRVNSESAAKGGMGNHFAGCKRARGMIRSPMNAESPT